jgi:MFS family permease
MTQASRTELTYRYERNRAVTSGILETAGSTFMLLIAVRWFHAGAMSKALLAAGGSLGLLATPLVVKAVEAARLAPALAASRLFMLGALCCALMAAAPGLPVFVLGGMVAMATTAATIPLMTQIYQENYPDARRGRLFSRTVMIRIAAAAIFSEVGGRVLSGNLERFRWLLVIFCFCFTLSSWWVSHCPSAALPLSDGSNPFRALRFVREDALFRRTLICWMLMGFANLMMFPMRVEYLANPRYGLELDVSMIALLTGVIPNCARLVLSPIWGWLFDRMNFFVLRVILNAGFALGILTFFLSQTTLGLVLGGIVFGVSLAGGDVAWSLWVTKFAPRDLVADYMSVHTFFTGVRGVLAPILAFHLLGHISIGALGWISTGLIVTASLMLLPEIQFGRLARPSTALVEDVSE